MLKGSWFTHLCPHTEYQKCSRAFSCVKCSNSRDQVFRSEGNHRGRCVKSGQHRHQGRKRDSAFSCHTSHKWVFHTLASSDTFRIFNLECWCLSICARTPALGAGDQRHSRDSELQIWWSPDLYTWMHLCQHERIHNTYIDRSIDMDTHRYTHRHRHIYAYTDTLQTLTQTYIYKHINTETQQRTICCFALFCFVFLKKAIWAFGNFPEVPAS